MTTIRTEDGVEVTEGDRAYDYYTMKPGKVGELQGERKDAYYAHDQQGSIEPWFTFYHDDGGRQLLNGQRICSIDYAKRRGFYGTHS